MAFFISGHHRLDWQFDADPETAALDVTGPDLAPGAAHDLAGNGQSQTVTVAGRRRIAAMKGREDGGQLRFGHARAAILYNDAETTSLTGCDIDASRDAHPAARRSVAQGIAHDQSPAAATRHRP